MKSTSVTVLILLSLLPNYLLGQSSFTKLDSLRGSITEEREWWDLNYYHLDIEVMPEYKFITGKVRVVYTVLNESSTMQIDLQEPMSIMKIVQDGKELSYTRFGPVHYIDLKKKQKIGSVKELMIYYEGYPKEAKNAPWDGGFTWEKDINGLPFVATSCQGLGASVWWPCKDHMYDEVDSMLISVEVPDTLINVSNGRLRNIEDNLEKGTKTFHWFVSNPINNYGVNVNIGDYVHWNEKYQGENGELDMDFWVLRENEEKARIQFVQASKTIEAFEYWMGPYPFYEDGYKLVEAPYLGMEHQSSVTYGNGYKNGYRGGDLSKTGWGLKFDYIIIHESGHEWFANNITYADAADMWIHEGFTSYTEGLYLDYWFGKEAGEAYLRALRSKIKNNSPVIGPYLVNKRGEDIYVKGSTLLLMIRQIVNDDEKWREILRGLGEEFYLQTVTSDQIEKYISKKAGIDLSIFFNQYLRSVSIPTFEYYFSDGFLQMRFVNALEGFSIPVDVIVDGEIHRVHPKTNWSKIELDGSDLSLHLNYYIGILKSQ